MNITTNTKFTFGKYRNTKLRDVPEAYLTWLIANLADTDFHIWVEAAKEEQERRKTDNSGGGNLEEQADAILRRAGYHIYKK